MQNFHMQALLEIPIYDIALKSQLLGVHFNGQEDIIFKGVNITEL